MNILQNVSTPKSSENKKHGITPPVLLFLFLAVLILLFAAALCFGSVKISPFDAVTALLSGDYDAPSLRILLHIRLPRACGAVLAGMALAVAGVLIQAVLHNPMAAPNVIGVNSGAGLTAVILLSVFPAAVRFLPLAAFFGAVGACACIYVISMKTGADRMTVTLVGIAVSAMLNAGISAVKTLYPDSVYDADAFMIGGLSGVTLETLLFPCVGILVGIFAALWLARDADVLSLGDETAKSLGMNVKVTQWTLLCLASVLAGCAVSFAGLLGFVGLIVPHIARRFVGEIHRWLIPASALGGGILVLLCDLIGRVLFAPYELPVGILLSLVGGPFFVCLLLARRNRYD
ncbi:MAG: iron ABC transporter permease [Clostridia bacterium]|nr:iron ABC transporter permease [Clostridia bacterium]